MDEVHSGSFRCYVQTRHKRHGRGWNSEVEIEINPSPHRQDRVHGCTTVAFEQASRTFL